MSRSKYFAWIILIGLAIVWGSSFILMKKSMFPFENGEMVLDPFQVGSMRIVIAGTALLPLAIVYLKYLNKKNWFWLFIIGFCGNLSPALLFTLAETKIDSALAGILNMTTSFFVILLGILFYKLRPKKIQYLGVLLGSLGLILLLGQQISFSIENVPFALLILLATLFYAISLTTIKYKVHGVPSLGVTSISFMLNLPLALMLAFYTDSFSAIDTEQGKVAIVYTIVLAIVGTAIAVALFTKLVQVSSAVFASSVTYLIPIVAVIIGVSFGENFSIQDFLWTGIIIFGVYLMNKPVKTKDI